MPEPAYKLCAHCGESFPRNKKTSRDQWERTQFCSRACAVRWRAQHEPRTIATGACSDCGENTVGLVLGRCKPCYSKARYKNEREHRLAVNRAWRERNPDYFNQFAQRCLERRREKYFGGLYHAVLERDASTCQHCGVVAPAGVAANTRCIHHIDGDPTHNTMENLQVLCNSCHAKEHYRRGDLCMKPRAA